MYGHVFSFTPARYPTNVTRVEHTSLGIIVYGNIVTHTSDTPSTCDICGAHFAWTYILRLHMITHKGGKPSNVTHMGHASRTDLL